MTEHNTTIFISASPVSEAFFFDFSAGVACRYVWVKGLVIGLIKRG